MHRVERCTSTNDLARQLAREGAPEGTAVAAEEQTAGRGTKGRRWYSTRKKGLYVSFVLRPKTPEVSLISLAGGLAVRQAIDKACGLDTELRWPNDLLWEGKKLAGILCETSFLGNLPEYVILGIGVNINHEEDDFPDDIRDIAISLKIITQRTADPEELLRHIVVSVDEWYKLFCRGESQGILSAYDEHSALKKGDEITVLMNDKPAHGIYHGLDPRGALLLKDESGIHRLTSAEIVKLL